MSDDIAEGPSKEVMSFASYLHSPGSSGLRAREGVLNGRRVQFFKGKSAINALTKDEDGRKAKFSSREEAEEWMQALLDYQLIVRCDKGADGTRTLRINPMQNFDEDGYYGWLYEGSQLLVILGGIGVVAVVLAGVMFPLWPSVLRNGTWYLSILALGLLGLLFATAIVRLIIYVITVATQPRGLWIFPNLFADVGFFESFVPLYGWDEPKAANAPAPAASVASANGPSPGATGPSPAGAPASAETKKDA